MTEEKSIHLVARNTIIISLITSKNEEFKEIFSLGYSIGERFESKYDLGNKKVIDTNKFNDFANDISELINQKNVPYLIKVAEFSKKEFGGEISIDAILKNNKGEMVKIDIISDRGEKKTKGIFNRLARMMKSFSEEVTFIRAIDGVAGRGEIVEFLDLMKTFGKLRHKSDEDQFPYYPSKAVIVAHDFSSTVFENLNDLPKYNNKHNIPGTHISPDAGMKGAPKTMKCFIEMWKWNENSYPERIFD